MSKRAIKKAVIPVAGLGTRFLPITKTIPKEMLPIIDKPVIHYIVEEAFSSGIGQIVFVNSRHKPAIEDYFDLNFELKDIIFRRGKKKDAELLDALSSRGIFSSVRQKQPLGLGHAIFCAYPIIGAEPFAVLLGDDVILPSKKDEPAIGQLIMAYQDTGLGQVALMQVPSEEVQKYGAAEGKIDEKDNHKMKLDNLVEKPKPGTERTNTVIVGRYVLPPSIWPILRHQKPNPSGEVQLTDALNHLLHSEGLMGYLFRGQRLDAGDRIGLLKLNILEALSRKDMRDDVLKELKSITQAS